jgi:RNA polymerase sigma factor (sigma-70 family)
MDESFDSIEFNKSLDQAGATKIDLTAEATQPARAADKAFIRALYAEHGDAMLRYALHLCGGDRQRAEDLVQETIVRAWRHAEAIADRPPRPWLFAVMRNLAVDAYRARQSRAPEDPADPELEGHEPSEKPTASALMGTGQNRKTARLDVKHFLKAFADGAGSTFGLFNEVRRPTDIMAEFENDLAIEARRITQSLGLSPEGRHGEGEVNS